MTLAFWYPIFVFGLGIGEYLRWRFRRSLVDVRMPLIFGVLMIMNHFYLLIVANLGYYLTAMGKIISVAVILLLVYLINRFLLLVFPRSQGRIVRERPRGASTYELIAFFPSYWLAMLIASVELFYRNYLSYDESFCLPEYIQNAGSTRVNTGQLLKILQERKHCFTFNQRWSSFRYSASSMALSFRRYRLYDKRVRKAVKNFVISGHRLRHCSRCGSVLNSQTKCTQIILSFGFKELAEPGLNLADIDFAKISSRRRLNIQAVHIKCSKRVIKKVEKAVIFLAHQPDFNGDIILWGKTDLLGTHLLNLLQNSFEKIEKRS